MTEPEFVTPPPLEPGDDVAVLAPSSGGAASAPQVLELGLDRLRETFDLNTVVFETAEMDDEHLRANPGERAADIHAAFADPDIGGVIATIGGDDQLRVLGHLDPDVLRENPTRFYGMSDNTNLALYLWNLGVVSFYGGQLMNQIATPGHLHEYTERHLRRAFFESSLGEIDPPEEWTDHTIEWTESDYAETTPEYDDGEGWTWHEADGVVEGRVWGGCRAIVEWQLATGRYLPEPEWLDGQVLAIETAEELPRAELVEWTLMCMGERGLLERFDAVLAGRPKTRHRHSDPGPAAREEYRQDQREAILGQMELYNPDATVVFDVDFGHTNTIAPIPIGGRVRIDGRNRTIEFP
jgi:muramoyltetrapeptide carboxypeptidase LdcA involved in peptidoglycan recycling